LGRYRPGRQPSGDEQPYGERRTDPVAGTHARPLPQRRQVLLFYPRTARCTTI
jgi:hypothetical protein